MKPPISTKWKDLKPWQAILLILTGIIVEVPVRWVARPDIPYMHPGNPWFNLPIRILTEIGFVLVVVLYVWMMKIRLPAIGVPFRKWIRWEWIAFVIVALIELTVVIVVAGHRWPGLYDAGIFLKALPWAFSEFLFGFNQEFVFRGALMSGLLRFTGPWWASILNTLLFLIGPLHGPGLWKMLGSNPAGAIWLLSGVVATGLFFSWLRYRTDNVVLCGILHGIVNGFLNGAGFASRAYL